MIEHHFDLFRLELLADLAPEYLTVPSKRRNPLLADFFSRLGLMERRGSGMKKIIDSYKRFERLPDYHAPEFQSNASEFHVTLWNLNYGCDDTAKEDANYKEEFANSPGQFANPKEQFANKGGQFAKSRKEFLKASRQIYNLISANPQITTAQMAEKLKISQRQVQKYLKRLQEAEKISRSGSRKNSEWKIIDEEYEGFFDRI